MEKTKSLQESESLFDVNINYIVSSSYKSNMDKIPAMIEAISTIPDNDIICFIDGFDVVVNSNMENILTNFYNFKCDLLFSTELTCYPNSFLKQMNNLYRFHNSNVKYRYLNSGGYIGYKFAVNDVLLWNSNFEKYNDSDKCYFIEYYLQNHKVRNLKLDHFCKIFQSM